MNNEEDNQVYVLNKNEQLLSIFNKDDDETLINPRIEKRQNSEAVFTFTIDTKNPKWEEISNPENLYLVNGMMFSTNFDGSFKETITESDSKTVEVTAYERQQLLSRKFVRAWNSETNLETIDTFMVVILSNGNLPLKNDGVEITTRYPKGSSGYVLEGLLYGTGWTVGTCDIYEYQNGEVVKDENNNPVYLKFDLETDQLNIYDNILKVQELWGGILVFDSANKIVHHRNETIYLPYNGYEVKYQKNMQSLEKKYNNKIITKLCPLGEGGLNIKSVNNNSVWLENYSYTNTVLEGIENNPDITDSTQLKKWGERKLEMLCKPSIELDVNIALLYQLDGYELETIDLNDIVDVINYNDVDRDYMQLRVVEFSYALWDKSDATVKLSNITLDSTDIFRQTITATNSINDGTLDAARVITLYKGGQSVEKTMFNMDGKVEFTYSTLMQEDTGIIARVTRTEDEYDTLSGVVGTHSEYIGEWDITSGSITSVVSAKVGDDEIISKINQSAEAVTINANKVGISANDVLNILAGNTLNLTSKNISIASDNFSVDASGNTTMNNANITGGEIYIDKLRGGTTPAITVDASNVQESVKIYGDKIEVYDGTDPVRPYNLEINGYGIYLNGKEYFIMKGIVDDYTPYSDHNFDWLRDSGFYYVGGNSISNAPSGFTTWYMVLVVYISDTFIFQYAYNPSTGQIAIRTYSGGTPTWSAWKFINSSKDAITIGLNGDHSYTATSAYQTQEVSLTKQMAKSGSRLSLSSGKVTIGAGVSKVLVSGSMQTQGDNTTYGLNIYKTNTLVAQSFVAPSGSSYNHISVAPTLVSVSQGDTIRMGVYINNSGATKNLKAYSGSGTYLTVEVIE